MQLIGALLFIAIFLLIVGASIYFAGHQRPRSQHYGSWSRVVGPQFNGSAMDVGERLNEKIAAGQHQARQARRTHHTRSKQR